jgi:hypothetical protein
VNSFHSILVEGAFVGVVDVSKVRDVQPLQNLHVGRLQVMVGWKVHATPPCAWEWDGVFGVHPRDNRGLPTFKISIAC